MKSIQSLEYDYRNQRTQARRRNIDWQLNFDTWLSWWISTGHLDNRGRRAGQYCMSRTNDLGPYSLENITCKTISENSAEGTKNSKLNGTYGLDIGNKVKKNIYGNENAKRRSRILDKSN